MDGLRQKVIANGDQRRCSDFKKGCSLPIPQIGPFVLEMTRAEQNRLIGSTVIADSMSADGTGTFAFGDNDDSSPVARGRWS